MKRISITLVFFLLHFGLFDQVQRASRDVTFVVDKDHGILKVDLTSIVARAENPETGALAHKI